MKVVTVCLFVIFAFGSFNAQDVSSEVNNGRQNAIYFELFGSGVLYSINYDRTLSLNDDWGVFFRVGGNEYHGEDTDGNSFNFLIGSGILFGKTKHFLELGAGYIHFLREPDRLFSITTGYRFQGFKGLILRVTPMYINNFDTGDAEIGDDTFGNSFWFGLSVGHSF
jgi:hypothetical protein